MKSERKFFVDFLMKSGFGGHSRFIPSNSTIHLEAIPDPETLIYTPETEILPIEPFKRQNVTSESLKSAFIDFQLDLINNHKNNIINESTGKEYEFKFKNGVEFRDPEEFLLFKSCLKSYINDKSKEIGYKEGFDICSEPNCLNVAVRNFSFCSNHLPNDANYSKQKFVMECSYVDNDVRCPFSCALNSNRCSYHNKFV